MAKLIRSARGTQVDFDLILIKQQIAANAAPTNVQSRDDFIENKIRRRPSRRLAKVGDAPVAARELGEEITTVFHDDLDEPEEFQEPQEELQEEPLPVKPVVKPVKK